ncbi:MAG: hypothetical protein M1821_004962 [Bathelium mastoideum]|nr:MAG: hypothetical protein M1821_004962 [Bathelium mastoideum]KAI9688995.1 MAG: hypothetical protein M1822_000732 [Bathelium mastoideum]
MGSSASKASRTAAGAAARKYPSRPSQAPPQPSNAPSRPPPPAQDGLAGPTVRPQPRASETRDEAINLDAADPAFAQSLRSLGPVQPNPQLSPSSTFPSTNNTTAASPLPPGATHPTQPHFPTAAQISANPALTLLRRREELATEAEREFQRVGKRQGSGAGEEQGRRFLDVVTIGRVLRMRDQGKEAEEIERVMGLRKGIVGRLGEKGVVEGI